MRSELNHQPDTFETVWAEKLKEYRIIEPEPSEEEKVYNRKMNKMHYRHNYIDEDDGSFHFDGFYVEEYFLTAFYYGKKTFFGVEFDDIENAFYPWNNDVERYEYDIVMFSDTTVAIIEIENNARKEDIPYILKKAETFKLLVPDYANCKLYIGLVTKVFTPELEQECIRQGIAIIRQVDGTVEIEDGHLKAL